MALFTIARADTWNQSKFVKNSQQLSQFMRGDFSSIAAELAKAFPQTKNLQERYVPLVQRYAHELSGLYARPVVRKFLSTQAESIDPFLKLQDVYRASRVDRFLHGVHRSLLVQRTMLIAVLPDGVGKVRLQAFEPWQVSWECSDPMRADDLNAASKVTLAVPISQSGNAIVFGDLVFTRELAYLSKGGQQVPVYGSSTRNPFGRIPLIVLRAEEPLPGRWAAPVNEPLLTMQVALCVSESDTELLVHTQAWGQKVLNNAQVAQQVEELQVGPDKVLALVNNDPTALPPSLQIVQGQPPLAQITGWNESRLRLLCSMFDLSPDAFLKVNTAVTASARAYDARDREESKARLLPVFDDGEQELAQQIAATLNLTDPLKIPVDVRVQVQFTEGEIAPADPLHETQALAAEVALGIRSRVRVVALREGVSYEAALRIVKANLQENVDLGGLPTVDGANVAATKPPPAKPDDAAPKADDAAPDAAAGAA